jgi:hypothetical protein
MPQQGHNPNNYGRALMSVIPRAITPNPHTNLLIIYIYICICRLQIKWGLKKILFHFYVYFFKIWKRLRFTKKVLSQ